MTHAIRRPRLCGAKTVRNRRARKFAFLALSISITLLGSCAHSPGPIIAKPFNDRAISFSGGIAGHEAVSLSPDGGRLIYSSEGDLHLFDIATRTDRQLTRMGPDEGWVEDGSALSHDARQVAFTAANKDGDDGIYVMSTSGQSARRLLMPRDGAPLAWTPDNTHLLVELYGNETVELESLKILHDTVELGVLSIDTGAWRSLKTLHDLNLSADASWYGAALSPDGRLVAYDCPAPTGVGVRNVFVLPMAGGTERLVFAGPSARVVGWADEGRSLLLLSDRSGSVSLLRVPMGASGVVGDVTTVEKDFRGQPLRTQATGRLLYLHHLEGQAPSYSLFVSDVVSDGASPSPTPRPVGQDADRRHVFPSWSPDGAWFSSFTTDMLGRHSITLRRQTTGDIRDIPVDFDNVWTMTWSPDSRRIVFRAMVASGRIGLYVVDIENGDIQTVVEQPNLYLPHLSSDGSSMTYVKHDGTNHQWSLVERGIESGTERVLDPSLTAFMEGAIPLHPGGISPDRRFLLAYSQGRVPAVLSVLDRQTRAVRELLRVDDVQPVSHDGEFQWLPGGRTAVANVRGKAKDSWEVWTIPVDGGDPRKLDLGVSNLRGSPIGLHPNGREIAFLTGPAWGPARSEPSLHQVIPQLEYRILEVK